MCQGCWNNEFGAARIDSPAVRLAAGLVQVVYQHSAVGGGLHAILDDWNIEDEYLLDDRFARKEDTPSQIAAETACLESLRALTLPERASALALHDGFWK